MNAWTKYLLAALAAAVLAHLAVVFATPSVLMNVAFERLSSDGTAVNAWRLSERVTSSSRAIVRPSPDFAYSACAYDLRDGPLVIQVAPWDEYWSLSLYAANSDNYFVIDDREARFGAEITLIRRGAEHPEGASMVIESPSQRGIALIRRLAPTANGYDIAKRVANEDVCASVRALNSIAG